MKIKQLIQRIALNRPEELPFPENLEEYLDDFIPNTLMKSETLQKAFGITPYEMEEIYSEAYRHYLDENYVEASTGFRWLVLFNPLVGKYWKGLGASLQLLEKYEKALHAYAMAALCDNEDPYPHFHAYQCYKVLNNKEEATKALHSAYRKAKDKSELKRFIERQEGYHVSTATSNTDHIQQ